MSQISTRLARQFGPILLMMPANRRTMIQSMLLRWVTMTLGNNPEPGIVAEGAGGTDEER